MRRLFLAVALLLATGGYTIYWFLSANPEAPIGVGADFSARSASEQDVAASERENSFDAQSLQKNANPDAAVSTKSPVKFLTNSVFPNTPLDVYLKRIEKAEDGDVDAQYDVYRALLECQFALKDETRLREFETGAYNQSVVDEIKFRTERCSALRTVVANPDAERKKWFSEAYANGHPLAMAYHQSVYGTDLALTRAAVAEALTRSRVYEAYEAAAIYMGRIQGDFAPLSVEPWSYLACTHNPGCDIDAYEEEILLAKYAPHDLTKIATEASAIEAAIDAGNLYDVLPEYRPLSTVPSQN